MKPALQRRDILKCILCDRGVMHDNQLISHRLEVGDYLVNVEEVSREDGLDRMLGPLAAVMGTDPDLMRRFDTRPEIAICMNCGIESGLAEILERIDRQLRKQEEQAEPQTAEHGVRSG